MSPEDRKTTAVRAVDAIEGMSAGKRRERRLLVVMGEEVNSYLLPRVGVLTIGRSEGSDIQIPHSTISRQHARVILGTGIHVEDCGSLNGVRVSGSRLDTGEQVELAPGEIAELGDAMVLVQQTVVPRKRHRIDNQKNFEVALRKEFDRAAKDKTAFAIMLAQLDDNVPKEVLENAVSLTLRNGDMVAKHGKHRYAFLFPEVTPAMAQTQSRRLTKSLGHYHTDIRVGLACFPHDAKTMDELLDRAKELVRGSRQEEIAGPVVMEDEHMRQLHRLIERIAPGSINVIIRGETGVGKEVVARLVHRLSHRPVDRFVSVNCAALPHSLLESELFGHEKGAFTGATKAKPGLLEEARNGTFLLDEVSEMPMPLQAKLLRMLEERQAVRIGGLKPFKIRARFISTSNRDLEDAVQQGTFRQDLLYRLDGITLTVPPLRERQIDIEPLARRFAQQTFQELDRRGHPEITEDALDWLRAQPWPGNVRELRNIIERSALLSTDGRITQDLLTSDRIITKPAPDVEATSEAAVLLPERSITDPFANVPTRLGLPRLDPQKPESFKDEMKQLEFQRIKEALDQCAGNQTEAAKQLGISRRTLINRLDQYGIARPRKRKSKKDK